MNLHAHLNVSLSLDDRKVLAAALGKYIEGLGDNLQHFDTKKAAVNLLTRLRPNVRITMEGRWKDVMGVLEGHVPDSEWWNVLIPQLNIRLCLVPDKEFTLLP